MKLLFSILVIAFFSSVAFSNITYDNRHLLNRLGSIGQKTQLGTLVDQTKNLLVARYSYAVQGGSTVADISLLTNLNDKTSYAVLPNKAIITNVWVNTLTQPTSGGSATIALKAQSAGDLLAATGKALFVANNFLQGVPAGTTTTFIKTTAQRTIKATVATSPLTAGKFDVIIEWVLGN